MREKYHTEAIILKTSDFKESNKLYHILSDKFGLILASAQGVRFAKSKLRYGLQEFSLSDVSIVRTGEIWKITNSSPKRNYYFDLEKDTSRRDAIIRITSFLRRFLHGEEEDTLLYSDLKESFSLLTEKSTDITDIENLFFLRSLDGLGLLKNGSEFSEILKDVSFIDALLQFPKFRNRALEMISISLKESQL